jgi:K+-sensing histidine kinase KdpD
VADVINQVKEIMHFKAEEKDLQLIAEIDKGISPVLIGDPTRLTQVLINLVGNAIKFTEKGTVSFSVQKFENSGVKDLHVEQNAELLSFCIKDTGIGMTDDQLSKLFKNYSQASSETARKYGGTGLGLSISKQLVELLGGIIQVESKEGMGSKFSFSLRYLVSKSKSVTRKENSLSQQMLDDLKGIRVLLADDNEHNRTVVRETLEMKIADIKIDEAIDGESALKKVKDHNYDLVLMDMVLPNTDGCEATIKIR